MNGCRNIHLFVYKYFCSYSYSLGRNVMNGTEIRSALIVLNQHGSPTAPVITTTQCAWLRLFKVPLFCVCKQSSLGHLNHHYYISEGYIKVTALGLKQGNFITHTSFKIKCINAALIDILRLFLVVLGQACVSWPIRGDWDTESFRRREKRRQRGAHLVWSTC